MAIKVYGDKIVFPDSSEQKTAYSDSEKNNSYTKAEVDAQQKEQDDKIQENTDAIEVNADNITKKTSEAPKDGKTYGRKNEAWTEVKTDSYTKLEIDTQQSAQDTKIDKNTTDVAKNTADIVLNKADIEKNKTDIKTLVNEVDALTGSVIYKGSLNATVIPAPADAVIGDMWINEYNVAEPATNYPVASGWTPVVEVKYDDKLIKTDAGWDKIESVVGVPSYTAGEIDALLDDKADKTDVYTKTEIDVQQTAQDEAIQDIGDALDLIPVTIYTKDEIDAQQTLQDDAIKANTDAIADVPTDVYTKAESDATNDAQDVLIQANKDAIDALPSSDDYYDKDEIDSQRDIQDEEIAKKANKGDSYTKSEANTLLDNKANVGDSYTKAETYSNTQVDGKLFEKADKTTTYTKTEVDGELLLKADKATTYNKTETDTMLAGKEAKGYGYSKAETDTKLNDKANTGVSYTKAETDTKLAGKANTGDSYTKAESNATNSAQDTKIAVNTAKVSNATHTGDVTGSVALTIASKKVTGAKIADNAVSALQINVVGNGVDNQMLCSAGTGAMKWVNQTSGGDSIPIGAIMIWSGATSAIPTGWKLCDGANGTPDLRNRFVIGAGSTYALKATGGSANAVAVTHGHTATSTVTDAGHKHLNGTKRMHDAATGQYSDSPNFGSVTRAVTRWEVPDSAKFDIDYTETKTTGITVGTSVVSAGESGTNKNLPPYTALYYIMKTTASRAVEEGQENVETIYSNQEVDKKLSIKDKLIEKMSARLDALEKKVK